MASGTKRSTGKPLRTSVEVERARWQKTLPKMRAIAARLEGAEHAAIFQRFADDTERMVTSLRVSHSQRRGKAAS
jgi:hypothetical protein